MTLPPDLSVQRKYLRWSKILHAILFLLPLLVLLGWLLDIDMLRRMGSPLVGMNPLTAICLLIGSTSFLLLRNNTSKTTRESFGMALAFLLLLLAGNRILGFASSIDLPVDTWLFAEKFQALELPNRSGRMSFNNAFCFLLWAFSLIFIRHETKKGHRISQYLALLIGLMSLLSLLSYLYQTGSFFGFISYIPMALNTAIAFFLYALSFLYAFPDKGFMAHISSKLSGSISARVLVPVVILLPTLFGLLRLWGYWRGFYDTEFGVTLFSLVTIITLLALAIYTAVSLNKRDLAQAKVQQALDHRQKEVSAVIENAPDAIIVLNRAGEIIRWNPESERLFGWKQEEVLGKMLSDTIVPEELREAHRMGMARYLGPEQSTMVGKTIEIWALHKNGQSIDVAIRISPYELDGQTFFIGFIRDITEKKRLETRLQQFNRELSLQVKEKTEELTDILDRITDGFIAVDHNYVYTYANKKIGEITGRKPEELIGKKVWEVFPDAVGSKTYQAFLRAMEQQEYITNTDHFEPLQLWQENHIYPSKKGLSVFIRDISARMRAEKEIDKVRSLADKLIDSLPGVFYFYDDKGKFIRWNQQFEEVTGYSSEEIEEMHPSQFFADDQKEYIIERITHVFEKGENDAEADLLHKNGTRTPHYFKAIRLEYEGKPCLLGTGISVTEKKKAEEELKLSEQKYRLLFHSNPLAMFMLSLPDYQIIEANESTLIQYGYTREEFLALDVYKLRPDEEIDKFKKYTDTAFRGIHYAGIWRHQKKDGTIIYVNIVTHDTWYEGKPVRLVLANEVTEQYLAEERLKESYDSIKRLTEHLNSVREQERLHIAREIHDELGQLLTVLKMDVSWLNKKLQASPDNVKEKLAELSGLLDTTVKTVRRISSELRPSLIDDLGLVAAMEWHMEEFQKRSGIDCLAQLPDREYNLSDNIKIGLYRILQESLTNVARHAQAKKVSVKLQKTDNQLILTVEDDGIGYDEAKRNKKTLGLVGARERAEGLGGSYSIEGFPGVGTRVQVAIPFSEQT
jgi:PAS domain S-box-containing protein